MKTPRGLTADEAAAWERLAASVTPLRPRSAETGGTALPKLPVEDPVPASAGSTPVRGPTPKGRPAPPPRPAVRREEPEPGLDSHWDRRFARGAVSPDFTLDLHGHTLDQAHARLDTGLAQAKAMGARVVLVIAGRPRPTEAADRGSRRGAIRAKLLDWLAAGPHGGDIAAVRNAHRRHGGEGALYLVLKRPR